MNKDLSNAENTELKMMVPAPMSIRISDPVTNELLGEFKEKEGLLTFEGKVDKAGKVFVDFVCETFKQRIKDNQSDISDTVCEHEKEPCLEPINECIKCGKLFRQ